jgi:hypothetical protein
MAWTSNKTTKIPNVWPSVIHLHTRSPAPDLSGRSLALSEVHKEMEPGHWDDVISWFYTIIEIAEWELSWPGSKDCDEIYRLNSDGRAAALYRSLLCQFIAVNETALALKPTDKPDCAESY